MNVFRLIPLLVCISSSASFAEESYGILFAEGDAGSFTVANSNAENFHDQNSASISATDVTIDKDDKSENAAEVGVSVNQHARKENTSSVSLTESSFGRFYIESGAGYYQDGNLTVGNFRYHNGVQITAANITTSSSPTVGYQFEIGMSNIYDSNFRASISGGYSRSRTRSWGSITAGGVTQTENEDNGYSSGKIYALNIYYDFKYSDSKWIPYVGTSAGFIVSGSFTKNVPVYGLMSGINYAIDKHFYTGIRGQYLYITQAITNDEGNNTLSPHSAYSLGALVGYKY